MPMAYAALISGMLTLIATSPNLVINYELIASGVDGFNFFAFTPFGIPILLASIFYMNFARRWLGTEAADDALAQGRPKMKKWVKRYQLADREYRVSVRPDSPLLGMTLEDLNLTSRIGARIILVERGVGRTRRLLARTPDTILQAGDVLLLDLDQPIAEVAALCEQFRCNLLLNLGRYFIDRSRDVGLVEVILPEDPRFARKTIAEAELLGHSELTVVGVRRGKTDGPSFNDAGRLEDIPARPETAVAGRMIFALFAETLFFP